MNRAASRHSWWEEAGPATCDFCLRAFHEETACYCAYCDRPVCPLCIVVIRQFVICPQCQEGR